MTGKIIKWDRERAFGFVMMDSGRGQFLHISNWESNVAPEVGMSVTFELENNTKSGKMQCVNTYAVTAQAGTDALKAGV